MLRQPKDLTVTEAKATERDTVTKVFPKMRLAISAPRAAAGAEVVLSLGRSLRLSHTQALISTGH